MEEWKPVPLEGYEHYVVSNTGRIKRLKREVPVTIFNNGRYIDTIAKRKELELKPQLDGGAYYVVLSNDKKEKIKKSLPRLVMQLFGSPCPGDENLYVVYHKDQNIHNNDVSNLDWMHRQTLVTIAGLSSENRDSIIKYHNIVIYYEDKVVAYFKDSNDMKWNLHKMGMGKNYSVSRLMSLNCKLFNLFTAKTVSDEEYEEIATTYYNNDLKLISDIINHDRETVGRVKTKIEYREKIVYKPKIEYKEKIVYRDRPVEEKKNEETKEKKKVLVNDRTTNVKKTKSKATKTRKTNFDDIDYGKDEPSMDDIMRIEEQREREHFKAMLRKLGV